MSADRRPRFLKRLMWATVPFLLFAMLAFVTAWLSNCGTQRLFAIPVLAVALILAAYWAIWALV